MATERKIPSPVTYIQDYGLNVNPPPAIRNKRVVIIGTAEDGPMYEPIQIDKPEDAEYVWGRLGSGDLVRGIFECWDVQDGYPTIVGVRLGNGANASLDIEEATGSGADREQGGNRTSLSLSALYPGAIYNNISINYDENRNVAIYNPKTAITSSFSFDTDHPNNPDVAVHNIEELVTAINADSNLNQIMTASYSGILSDYEIKISGLTTGVNNTSTFVELNMYDVLNAGCVTTNGFMVPVPLNSGLTAANNWINFEAIEAVSISEWETLECAGKTVNKFKLMPLDGKAPATWHTIQTMYDYNGDAEYVQDPTGVAVSEFIHNINYGLMDGGEGEGGPTISGGYCSSGVPTNTIRISVPLCLDDSEESLNNKVASGYIAANTAIYSAYTNANWKYATCYGIATKEVDGVNTRPSGLITVQIGLSSDPNGFWQTLPYDTTSGIYLSSYTSEEAIFSVGVSGFRNPLMQTLVDANNSIRAGIYLRVSANTVKGFLTEKSNLNALDTTSSTLSEYFVRGQEIIFNTVPSFNMTVNYGTRISYEVGSTVEVTDPANGILTFNTVGLLPGPGGAELSNSNSSYIRLRYNFMPNWPNITTAAKVLSGGTNGNVLSGSDRKTELIKTWDKLKNYTADLWVPMGAYIDDITERYNPMTGLKETVPVDYVADMIDFLEDLSINSIQPHAIFGVTPMDEVTQANKDLWVTRLTTRDLKDPNRGANIMAQIGSKYLSVVAFEPVFMNYGRGQPYVSNGQAAYAGYIASLPYDISPTNKSINGIQSLRFSLAISQYEALNGSRYVTMKTKPGRDPVIVEDVTAATPGSDFVNWSTYSITAESANRVYNIAETFIGRPNSVEVRTSLEQLISNALMSMSGLRGFNFTVTSTPTQQVLGVIEVDLIIVPVFTIKKIRTTVKLRKNLPTA